MLSELQKRNQTRMFNLVDRNQDNKLTWEDHQAILDRMAKASNISTASPEYLGLKGAIEANWNELKRHADLDKDDAVTLDEWIAHHDRMLGTKEGYQLAIAAITQSLLGIADRDRDGKLSQSDWTMLLDVYGVDGTKAKQSFEKLDTDHDGVMTQQELLSAVEQFVRSTNPSDPGHWLLGPPA